MLAKQLTKQKQEEIQIEQIPRKLTGFPKNTYRVHGRPNPRYHHPYLKLKRIKEKIQARNDGTGHINSRELKKMIQMDKAELNKWLKEEFDIEME